MAGLELKGDDGCVVFFFVYRIGTIVVFEKFLKVLGDGFLFFPGEHTIEVLICCVIWVKYT